MHEHLEQDAAAGATEQPGLNQRRAEQRDEERRHDVERKLASHQRQMPEPPDRRKDQAGRDWSMFLLELREREAAPARLFAETDKQENENEAVGQLAPFVGFRKSDAGAGEKERERGGDGTEKKRHAEDEGVPAQPNA